MAKAKSSYLVAEEPAFDLAVVQVMAVELEPYLLADHLYHTITVSYAGAQQNLQMTGADLLTRLHRLIGAAAHLTDTERRELARLQASVAQVCRRLQPQWQERLAREIKARLSSLQWFLDDCLADSPTEALRCHVEFPFEMRNRQRIEEGLKALDYHVAEHLAEKLQRIDRQIRRIAPPSSFVWDERLRTIFPEEAYWYLYRRPPRPD